MTSSAIFRPVAALMVAGAIAGFSLAGCSGGSSTFVAASPTPTPNPNATVRAVATSVGGQTTALVTWTPSAIVSLNAIVEYHVFRDGRIVGTVTSGTQFSDAAQTGQFVYRQPNVSSNQILDTVTGNKTAFTTGTSHTYRVTVIYTAQDTTQTPAVTTYNERTIGTADPVTF